MNHSSRTSLVTLVAAVLFAGAQGLLFLVAFLEMAGLGGWLALCAWLAAAVWLGYRLIFVRDSFVLRLILGILFLSYLLFLAYGLYDFAASYD